MALGLYYLWQHFDAAGQITDLAATTTPVPAYTGSGPSVSQTTVTPSITPITSFAPLTNGPSVIAAGQPITASSAPNNVQLQDLLNWATETKNPSLYQAMINQLSASDLNSLYGILVNQWDTGASPTLAETTFWNYLRGIYPFLNTAGVGCNNFTCT